MNSRVSSLDPSLVKVNSPSSTIPSSSDVLYASFSKPFPPLIVPVVISAPSIVKSISLPSVKDPLTP